MMQHHSCGLAIITGASSGIGLATATDLAQRGFRTMLIARRTGLLEAAATRLSAHAPSVPLTLDLSHIDAIEPVVTQALDRHHDRGEPLVLVNCAGFGVFGPFLEQPAESFESLARVNYLAPARMVRAVLPRMLDAERSHVFNVSSMSAVVGTWGHAGYGASKAAMRNMTETLASEFSERGVRFTTVFPGIIRTPYFEKPDLAVLWQKVKHRAIPPERVARAIGRAVWSRRLELHVPAHYSVLDWGSCAMLRATIAVIRRSTRPPSASVPVDGRPSPSRRTNEPEFIHTP